MGNAPGNLCKKCTDCFGLKRNRASNANQYIALTDHSTDSTSQEMIEEKKADLDPTVFSVDPTEFLEICAMPPSNIFEKLLEKEGFIVYGQDIDEGFIIKAEWKSKFTGEEIIKFSRIADLRHSWDKNIDHIEELPTESQNEFITYTILKKALIISQREIVMISNIRQMDDGMIVVSKSCDHEKFPETEKFIRMTVYVGGYYFKNICDGEFKTHAISITKGNFGGTVSSKLAKKATALALPKLYQNMEKCMEKYYKDR
ncbi:hypothetical protein SteCoe_11697 [Stentor coeruleus]|uniref:START domain-containing protein n=1 Tax=Stentor coeruleus TaxID=5963 RepID=A0A1R2CCF6_9CILI|nr:hypothetical protein SteCoe_11697 [Stentor coeruleus]